MHKKYYFIGLILCAAISMELTSYYFDTLNPFDVFNSDVELYMKVIVGIPFLIAAILLIYFFMSLGHYDVKVCLICNKRLTTHRGIHGKPKVCWSCYRAGRVTQFHEKCFHSLEKCPVCGAPNHASENPGEYPGENHGESFNYRDTYY